MSQRAESGLGTVRTVRDRQGNITGYQPLLPRSLSTPPADCSNPKAYKEPVGGPLPTKAEARQILDAAIVALRRGAVVRDGVPFSHYVHQEIQSRLHEARRKYSPARANRLVSTWRSIDRLWLAGERLPSNSRSLAAFYSAPPAAALPLDLQRFFDHLRDEAEGKTGEPLSGDFIRNVARLVKASFERAGLATNPAAALKLPPKGEPRVPYLDLSAQRRLFAERGENDERRVELEDRVMIGCGMGGGLRVGELLSMEEDGVRIDDADPHLLVRYGGADRSPTKSGRARRVELLEPGLGFWRLWMDRFYRGGRLVFEGPLGGFRKHWPERFPLWAATAGVPHLSSHIMRHSYAVAMLSGTWGYSPKSLEFVQVQLGHSERSTTERFYGAFEVGTWTREARVMRGDVAEIRRSPITAIELLGLVAGATSGAAEVANRQKLRANGPPEVIPRRSPKGEENAEKQAQFGATLHQARADRIDRVLAAVAAGEPTALRQAVEVLQEERELHQQQIDLATQADESEADVG